MKLYKITFNKVTWDQYDAFILWANSPEEVLEKLEAEGYGGPGKTKEWGDCDWSGGYKIEEELPPKQATIVLSSFNAG